MDKGVAITGMGIISAIGDTVSGNYDSLVNGRTAITDIDNIDTVHKGLVKVGEIKNSNQQLVAGLGLPESNNFPRTAMLGLYAAKQAVENAGILSINQYSTGLISASSVGGMDMNEKYFFEYFNNPSLIKYIHSQDIGSAAHQIADGLGIKGLVTNISTACSSAANAIMFGARLIKSGKLDRVIVGGTDALSKFTINGFKALMILTDGYNAPFDNNRKGLNLGEAAAYLVLESEEIVKKENYEELVSYLIQV